MQCEIRKIKYNHIKRATTAKLYCLSRPVVLYFTQTEQAAAAVQ